MPPGKDLLSRTIGDDLFFLVPFLVNGGDGSAKGKVIKCALKQTCMMIFTYI